MRSEHQIYGEFLILLDSTELVGYLKEWEGVASLKGKVKVEISTVLNDDLAFLDLIYEDIAEPNLAFLILLNRIDPSTEEDRMRQHITDSLDVDADGSVPSHYVAIDVVVEGL